MKQLSENDAYENYYQFVGATKYRKPLEYSGLGVRAVRWIGNRLAII